jgi:hypothetical protein
LPAPIVRPSNTPSGRSDVRPLAPERYKVQFTVSRETYDKLRRAQDLLRHAIPNGDPAAIFDRALTALVDDLTRTKVAATSRPRSGRTSRSGSRHMPAAVRREVWKRDGARCAFVGTKGRCTETGFLEFHHVVPFAEGGGPEPRMSSYVVVRTMRMKQSNIFGVLFVCEEAMGYGNRSGPRCSSG